MNELSKYKLCSRMKTTPAGKLLYLYLLDAVNEESMVTIPVKRLALLVGLSCSAVSRNLHRLKRIDLLDIQPQYSEDGGRKANRYLIL